MKRNFRDFKIERTCLKSYKMYTSYKSHLKRDFSNRCAYCNLLDSTITTPFEVDHFIPRNTFENEWCECDTLYENLIYSCKKCNLAKGSYFKGDISKKEIMNDYFYNPVDVDYGKIFYRDDAGGIASDDEKGRDMINKLKLYRPIHNVAWICEIIKKTLDNLNAQIDKVGKDSKQGELLKMAKNDLIDYYLLCNEIFLKNYNNEKFTLEIEKRSVKS